MPEERRKSVRLKKTFTVQYLNKNNNLWDMSSIRDLSESGICFNTNYTFLPSEVIVLRVKLPSDPLHWIEIKAKVVESRHYVTRAEFIDLEEEKKVVIRDYIANFLKSGG